MEKTIGELKKILQAMETFEGLCRVIEKFQLEVLLEIVEFRSTLLAKKFHGMNGKTKVKFETSVCVEKAKNTFVGCFKTQIVGGGTIYDAIFDMKQNLDQIKLMYSKLEDSKSKEILYLIMYFRFFADKEVLKKTYSRDRQYYVPKLITNKGKGVFVDCGAFDGDTVKGYIEAYGDYKKIYAYEPVPENFRVMEETLEGYEDIVYRNAGVSNQKATMHFTSHLPGSANRLNPYGDVAVDIVTLDEDVKEPVSFIKMDIEGAELDAIIGARRHIVEDKPQLAICIYHTIADLWQIFYQIYQFNPNQRFNIRHHRMDIPEEIVLYASPNEGKLEELDVYSEPKIVKDDFDKLLELMLTVTEGIGYARNSFENRNINQCRNMLEDVSFAIDATSKKLMEISTWINK